MASWHGVLAIGLVANLSSVGPKPGRRGPVCSFDTASATIRVPVVGYLAAPGSIEGAGIEEAVFHSQSLTPFFTPPSRIEIGVLPLMSRMDAGNPQDSLKIDVGGPLLLPLTRDGRLQGEPVALTRMASVNEALVAAARLQAESGPAVVANWVAGTPNGPVELTVVVAGSAPVGTVPLFRTRIPVYVADSLPSQDTLAKPGYPRRAQERRIPGNVDVRYLIRADGFPDPASIEVLMVRVKGGNDRTDRERLAEGFARSAIEAIARSRFRPAMVQGCPVPSVVRQRVSFAIG